MLFVPDDGEDKKQNESDSMFSLVELLSPDVTQNDKVLNTRLYYILNKLKAEKNKEKQMEKQMEEQRNG